MNHEVPLSSLYTSICEIINYLICFKYLRLNIYLMWASHLVPVLWRRRSVWHHRGWSPESRPVDHGHLLLHVGRQLHHVLLLLLLLLLHHGLLLLAHHTDPWPWLNAHTHLKLKTKYEYFWLNH